MEKHLNIISETNGAVLVECTSEVRGCSAENVLNSNDKRLWLTEQGLPQEIVIDISKTTRPQIVECFGWYCWHSYKSNPALVELFVSENLKNWSKWGIFNAKCKTGYNLYYIEPITAVIKYIKICILSTHGASNTYMNQVFLLENMPNIKCTENSAENSFTENSIESDKPLKDQSPHKFLSSPVEESFQLKKNPFKEQYQAPELIQPFQTIKSYHLPKIDEVDRLKKEIANWAIEITNVQNSIEELTAYIERLQRIAENNATGPLFSQIREEILKCIKNDSSNLESSRSYQSRNKNFEEFFNKKMKLWETNVFKPTIKDITAKTENKADPEEILRKIEEKMKYKEKLLKKREIMNKLKTLKNKYS